MPIGRRNGNEAAGFITGSGKVKWILISIYRKTRQRPKGTGNIVIYTFPCGLAQLRSRS